MILQDIFKKICIFIVAAFLLSYNLSDRYLWYDEACTANVTKNILKYGYPPKAYDGKNLAVAWRDGLLFHKKGDHLYIYSEIPPLQYFLTAVSFKLFGVSTYTARLPFVIVGVVCVFLFGRLARKFGMSSNVASIFLALNAYFLIYCRNSRYYALVFLFSILLTDFYLQFLKNSHKRALLKFTITSVLFAYTHQLAFFGLHLGFFVYSLLFLKKSKRLYFVLVWFLPVLSYLPWHYFFFPPARLSPVGILWVPFSCFVEMTWFTAWKINNYIAPFVFLGVLPFILFFKKNLAKETILLCILSLCIIGGIIAYTPILHHSRYILGSFPLLLLLVLLVLEHIKQRKLLYYTILATLICTNFFHRLPTFLLFKVGKLDLVNFANITSIFSGHKPTPTTSRVLRDHTKILYNEAKFSSPLCLYLFGELFSKYKTREEALVEYLRKHVKDDDTFMVWEWDAEVLIFYLGNIRVVNRLSEKSHIKPDPTACPIDKVKWIIPHKSTQLLTLAQNNNYHKIILNYPDLPHLSQSIPDPEVIENRYRIDYSQPNIVIYKKDLTF